MGQHEAKGWRVSCSTGKLECQKLEPSTRTHAGHVPSPAEATPAPTGINLVINYDNDASHED